MSKRKFLTFTSLILALAVVVWLSGDAFAEGKGPKPEPGKPVTTDDVAKYLGKPLPSEQKAAAKRARQNGLYPGVAGKAAQSPNPGAGQETNTKGE
jgi:hypothetical protein